MDNCARVILVDGPFDGEQVGILPTDTPAPIQIVWSGWFPWGPASYLYEWHGETTMDRGRTDALIYRPTGRLLAAGEIPPLMAEVVEVWASSADMIVKGFGVPAEMIWPGV